MTAINDLAAYLSDREKREPGQQTRLAQHLGVSQGLVWQWLNSRTPIAAKHARGIEAYTDGHVTRYDICPEIFGPAPPASETAGPNRTTSECLDELSQLLTEDENRELIAAIARGPDAAAGYLRALEHRPDVKFAVTEILIVLGHKGGGDAMHDLPVA
jgi:DNA-binding transcriptional regulator YdaS (Cro superfamily)